MHAGCWSGLSWLLKRSTILIPFMHFICVIRWAFWLLGSSACPVASRLLGFSACPVASRLLGFSGGFSASRLVRWLLGFSACFVLLGFSASQLLGFSACPVVSRLLGFSASGRISGPRLPVHWKCDQKHFAAWLIINPYMISQGTMVLCKKAAMLPMSPANKDVKKTLVVVAPSFHFVWPEQKHGFSER